ncbi:unnamed protein product [Rotaria sp. Silwood1]|nr:unnamed protein product [Rotaria sp. Silwood1]CAF3400377.1 unnamed protein product [Rotaria sp. Silwood1]CAF3436461.1 unnamed protein product [Rotaria sp. Silwood1]CAF3449494.1 unnamed protein product [Rotaria sp. Silwood1]CAF4613650.1 unnamed protein product [Rotaria sp. Silwood1]
MKAAGGPSQYMVTKNTKFEAKLARYLISNPGDQLLGYDACIEKQGNSINYRLIVLGLESIYLPDNPPKIAQLEKPYIYYRDILRAEMIDDYPDFLAGVEQKNTLHMRLRVVMPSNKNKKNKKKKPKSTSVDEMETVPSLFDRLTLENINNYMEPITPRRTASSRELYQTPLPQLSAVIPFVLTATTTNESDPLNLPLHRLDDLSTPKTYDTSLEFKERLDELNLNTDRSNVQRLLSTQRTFSDEHRIMVRSKSAKSLTMSKKKTNNDSDWNTDTPRLSRYALQVHQDDRYGTLHTPRSTPRGTPRQNLDDELLLLTNRSTLTDLSLTSNININAVNNEDSPVYCPSVEEVRSLRDDLDQDMKEIDIYFLSLTCKIPEILSCALSNYIVISTLYYKSDHQSSTLSNNRLHDSMDITMVKFSQLKNEILQSFNNTNQLIKLTTELCNACEKYSKVKDLFWKDHDLFTYYVAQFQSCSQDISNNDFDDATIDFSCSILQLLNEIFLNTFASNERLSRLSHDECARLQTLIHCLLTPPITLLSTQPTTTTTASDDSEVNERLQNTYKIVLKWMFGSGTVLWHIGNMLSRPSWTSKSFRFRHFIELFEKQQQKDEYFDLFIDALSRLIMNKDNKDPFSPNHALYVYQFFSILSMLLINSTMFSEYIRDRYLEDFKYFLKEDIILSRIPVQYPVYRFIPELIRSVHHRILYGEPNYNLSNRPKHHQLI